MRKQKQKKKKKKKTQQNRKGKGKTEKFRTDKWWPKWRRTTVDFVKLFALALFLRTVIFSLCFEIVQNCVNCLMKFVSETPISKNKTKKYNIKTKHIQNKQRILNQTRKKNVVKWIPIDQ